MTIYPDHPQTATIVWPTIDSDANDRIKRSRDEMAEAALVGFQNAARMFEANPTPETFEAKARAHTLWAVAFEAIGKEATQLEHYHAWQRRNGEGE